MSLVYAGFQWLECRFSANYFLKFWVYYYILFYTHHQELMKSMGAMVASHLYSCWMWWSDTFWMALTRLWPHSFLCTGFAATDGMVTFEVLLWRFLYDLTAMVSSVHSINDSNETWFGFVHLEASLVFKFVWLKSRPKVEQYMCT